MGDGSLLAGTVTCMSSLTTESAIPAAAVTEADVSDLFAAVRPSALKMRAMLTLALSPEGLHHDVFGRGASAYSARLRSEAVAVRNGFVLEVVEVGRTGRRTMVRARWLPQFRCGVVALLDWGNGNPGESDPTIVRWLSQPEARLAAASLLRRIGEDPELVLALPRHPTGTATPEKLDEMTGWIERANDAVGAVRHLAKRNASLRDR